MIVALHIDLKENAVRSSGALNVQKGKQGISGRNCGCLRVGGGRSARASGLDVRTDRRGYGRSWG
jgi:hypothetical protein